MSYDFKTHNFPLPLSTAISNKKSFSYTKGFSFHKSVQPRINRPDDKISTYVYSTIMPYLTKRRYTAPFLSAAILIGRNYNASSKGLQRKPRRDIQYRVHFYIHLSFSNAVLFKRTSNKTENIFYQYNDLTTYCCENTNHFCTHSCELCQQDPNYKGATKHWEHILCIFLNLYLYYLTLCVTLGCYCIGVATV